MLDDLLDSLKPKATMTDAATTTAVTPNAVTTTVKPGWRTSEFWLKLAANALTVLFASGVITGNVALAIAGIAAAELGSLGYTVARTAAKS